MESMGTTKRPMQRAKEDSSGDESREIVRVTFRLHGPELLQIREVQQMLSLNSELDAARYLMQRGLEALSAVLASRRSSQHMAAQVSTEKIIEQMIAKLGISGDDLKKLA
jgi:hypothetical protein